MRLRVVLALLLTSIAPSLEGAAIDVVPTAALDSVLVRFVRGGRVDYRGLAADRGALRRFLAATEQARPEDFSRPARIAFWVNAYNARVLDGVIRRPGLKSVLDSVKIAGTPTLGFFREPRLTAGRKISLNDIEHGILRNGFDEPRIHFVLNCASTSCPELPGRAVTAARLDSVLGAATTQFLGDRTKNRIGADGRLELSSIFKCYGEDFRSRGGVVAFVAATWPGLERVSADARLTFLPYDWSLNGSW